MEPQPSTSKAQNEYDDFLDRTAGKSMSKAKLLTVLLRILITKKKSSLVLKVILQRSMYMMRKHMASSYQMLSYYPNVLANQLIVAHAEIQNQNSSFFKTAPAETALLNYFL